MLSQELTIPHKVRPFGDGAAKRHGWCHRRQLWLRDQTSSQVVNLPGA
jgi:hypothetical protein